MNGEHRTRNTSSPKFILIIGRSHFYSNTVQTKSFEGVCLKENNMGFSITTTKILVEVILLHKKTAMKVMQSDLYWPSLFKDAYAMCRSCDRCQRPGKLSHRNMMPLNLI